MLLISPRNVRGLASKKKTEQPVTLQPVDPEDMWHAHNLIHPDDVVKAAAIRRVKMVRDEYSSGGKDRRVFTDITIKVVKVFFDPAASSLHVNGISLVENEGINTGQYHTLDLELHRPFTLWKEYGWDNVSLQQLEESLNQDKDGAVAAVVMQDGFANICLITNYQTILKVRVESNVPKKQSTSSVQDAGTRKFFEKTLSTLLRSISFAEARTLLLASPGFTAQEFKKYISSEAARKGDKQLKQIASDAVLAHSSSGHLHALNEVLKNKEVQQLMHGKRFMGESQLLDNFYDRMRKDDGRAWYGVKPVEKAVREGAVGRGGGLLLINNSLFRSLDIETRKRYVAIVDKVTDDGGDARILSSDHESGERLDGLGGIAALLTYPMVDLDEDEDDDDSDEGGGGGGGGGDGEMVI